MHKYKGVVREIYEYKIDVDAEDGADAIAKLKELYSDHENNDGIFIAESSTFLRAEFSLRSRN